MNIKKKLLCVPVCILLTYRVLIEIIDFFLCPDVSLGVEPESGVKLVSEVAVCSRPQRSHLAIIRAEQGERGPMRDQGQHTLTNHKPGATGDYY